MILNRLGNKSAIAKKIIPYFPKHDIYMEPFFGAGGMFFNKPKAKYNFLNDNDDDVYNLYRCLLDKTDELVDAIKLVPITERQFKEWSGGAKEQTDVMNAVRFLVLSNYGLYGKKGTMTIGAQNPKKEIIKYIETEVLFLSNCHFFNEDFRNFFKKIVVKNESEIRRSLLYLDPPYIKSTDNYATSFVENDSIDLLDLACASGVNFAMSEFDNEFILQQANERGLNVTIIGERTNLKNKRTEILVTNYPVQIQHNIFI